jgi:putative MATE family efflux protein
VSWPLVLGVGPLPRLGWDGIVIGTACGHCVGGAIILGLMIRGRAGLHLRLTLLRPDRDLIRRLLRIGLPGGADQLAVVSCHLWYVSIINGLGDVATAAHAVGVRIESISYLPGFAFQIAATTLVGQYLGAKDYRRASRSVWVTLLWGGGVMVVAGAVMYAMPVGLARLFIRQEQAEVIALVAVLLPIVAWAMPALATISILGGALRGAGDTRLPLAFTFIGLILVRIPGAYWLAYESLTIPFIGVVVQGWNLGVPGAWYAMVVDAAVRCALIVFRFSHGGWKRVRV